MSVSAEVLVMLIVYLISIGIWVGQMISFKKHINYRLDKIELKQDKHNSLIERMVAVEQKVSSAHRRIDGIENKK